MLIARIAEKWKVVKVDFWIIAMTEMKKVGNAGRQKACKSLSGIARKAVSRRAGSSSTRQTDIMLFWLAGNTICQEGRKSEKQKDVGLPVSFLSWFRVQRVDQTQHANSAGAGPTCAGSSQRNGSGGVAVGLSSQSRPSVITSMSRCADGSLRRSAIWRAWR